MAKKCPWCEVNAACGQAEDCDFRTLKMEKKAIITRIKEERKYIDKAKETLLKDQQHRKIAEKDVFELMDKLAGVSIMTKVLKENFNMTDEDIREACGFKALSLLQKARLAMIMQTMKQSRRE